MQKLDKAARARAMSTLGGWKKTRGRDAIEKTFVFSRFQCGFCLDVPRGNDGRKTRPPPGMVKCVQNRQGDLDHA